MMQEILTLWGVTFLRHSIFMTIFDGMLLEIDMRLENDISQALVLCISFKLQV